MKPNNDLDKTKDRANTRISAFARHLLTEWHCLRLPIDDKRVVVAVSGGADSTALLLALDEIVKAKRLATKITIAHLDHGLRDADGEHDAAWVNELARTLDHDVALERIDVRQLAIGGRDNLEQAARHARYQFLLEVASRCDALKVLTAHTMDDQAETVLLRLMRGSGVEGLGGIKAVRLLDTDNQVSLVRPLLRWSRRSDTENYCRQRNVAFRTDAMNNDVSFNRVRVRKHLLPLMESFNPRIVETLSRTSAMLQTDASALRFHAQELLREAELEDSKGIMALRVDVLADAHMSVRRRALREWIKEMRGDARRLELVHLLAVEKLVFGEQGGRIAELPGGSFVERNRGQLHFHSSSGKS